MHYKWFLKPMTPAVIICLHIMVPLKTICPVTSVVSREENCEIALGGLSVDFDKSSWESGKNRKLLEKCTKLNLFRLKK